MVKGVHSCCQLARWEMADLDPSESALESVGMQYLEHTEAGKGTPFQSTKCLCTWLLLSSRRQVLLIRGVEGGENWWIKVLWAQVAGTRRAKHL